MISMYLCQAYKLMKKIFLIVLLISMVLQGVNRGLVYVQFQLNRDYIAQNLCVKKEIKNNCCQGSCQLGKKLGDDSQTKNRSGNNSLKGVKEFWLLQTTQEAFSLDVQPINLLRSSFTYARHLTIGVAQAPFHPPILS